VTPWMQTYTGRRIVLENPCNIPVELVDIAHSLSMTCRFGGHCSRFYSVAEHCVHVAEYVWSRGGDRDVQALALMHDAAEAYLGDLISPVKRLLGAKPLEDRFMLRIKEQFKLFAVRDPLVTEADQRMLASEVELLMPKPVPEDWAEFTLTPWPEARIECWTPSVAYQYFMAAAEDLGII